MQIIPAPQTAQILAGRAPMPGTSALPQVSFNYYGPKTPDAETRASMLRDLSSVLGALA
jgi:hypothetical protein